MTEKKTFKHPLGLTSAFGSLYAKDDEGGEYEIYSEAEGLHRFPLDEWDIEVTFTKKVKPIQINSVVEDLAGNTGRVVSVQADKAWVHYYLNDSGRAVDFDCVERLYELTNVS